MWKQASYRIFLTLFVAAALLGVIAPGQAETPVAAKTVVPATGEAEGNSGGVPRLRFDSLEHDFGQAVSGEDLKTTFTFKNAGDGVLVIEKVRGG